jgi:hypothetical protein
MKRFIPTIVILIIIVLAGVYLFRHYSNADSLKNAYISESEGNHSEAFQLFTKAFLEKTPSQNKPDVNRSKILSVSVWRKELFKYIEWVCVPSKMAPEFNTLHSKINQYQQFSSETENLLINIKTRQLDIESYTSIWKKNFYASTAPLDTEAVTIASGNHFRKVSFLKLSSEKSYTYEMSLFNISNGKQTKFLLYPESIIHVLASPGAHLLVCRSTFSFKPGELWQSRYAVIPVTIPESTSEVSGSVITKIARKK